MSVSAAFEGDDPSPDPSSDLSEASDASDGAPVTERHAGARLDAPPRMLLTDAQWRTEHVLAARVAVEHARVTGAADSRTTTGYVNQVLDNARLLSGGNPRLFLNLVRHMVRRLKSLPAGSDELRW